MFKANYMDSNCLRCGKTVYPTDKIGPLKDYSFFHSGCFRCVECGSKLTLKAGSIVPIYTVASNKILSFGKRKKKEVLCRIPEGGDSSILLWVWTSTSSKI
jgi:hypothetical protein